MLRNVVSSFLWTLRRVVYIIVKTKKIKYARCTMYLKYYVMSLVSIITLFYNNETEYSKFWNNYPYECVANQKCMMSQRHWTLFRHIELEINTFVCNIIKYRRRRCLCFLMFYCIVWVWLKLKHKYFRNYVRWLIFNNSNRIIY